jgi:soluble lytic murein transglycosylase-like protein
VSRRASSIGLLASLLLQVAAALPAGETVRFRNGRRMRVEASERQGARYVLRLANGGVIEVPVVEVARIDADPEPAAAAEESEQGPGGTRLEQFMARKDAGPLRQLISRAARTHRLEEELLVAVVFAESGFDPRAVSPKGAMGLMQLMPDTADRFGVEQPFDPWQNLNGGAAYLRQLSDKYGGDLKLALAAYNAGEGRIQTYRGMPPFSETIGYVSRVLTLYRSLRQDG